MDFIVVGKGGREHALAHLLAQRAQVASFGGSDAIHRVAPAIDKGMTVNLSGTLPDEGVAALCAYPEAVIVFGPEQPMAAGWVDQIRQHHPDARVLGPNQYAAQLESSKWWAKEFMQRHAIPTGAAERIKQVADFDRFALQFEPPYVIKADGLAAGKGVALFDDAAAAREFVSGIVDGSLFGQPQTALIEEYLSGPELSIFLLLDGKQALQLATARDYKRAYDSDAGPNTGGMGSFTPVPDVTSAEQAQIDETVLQPILAGLRADGIAYRGFLYVGLMRTASGFRVLEFNVRLGDPETQAVLPVIGEDLGPLLAAAADGRLGDMAGHERWNQVGPDLARWQASQAAVCVVLAAPDYPASSSSGVPLSGLAVAEQQLAPHEFCFHAGTRWNGTEWCTDGGRVVSAVATGDTVGAAREQAYALVDRLNLTALRHRRDIAG